MTRSRIGRLIERELLSQRRLQSIGPRRFGSFSFRRQAAECRFNGTRIDGLELLDVSHNLGDLRREHPALIGGDVEVRELRDLFNVGFSNRHDSLKRSAFNQRGGSVRVACVSSLDAVLRRANKSRPQFFIRNRACRKKQFRWRRLILRFLH